MSSASYISSIGVQVVRITRCSKAVLIFHHILMKLCVKNNKHVDACVCSSPVCSLSLLSNMILFVRFVVRNKVNDR